jgi:Transmembrane secretion effector
LHIDAAELGFLYTIMGVGSVIAAAFILPWGRARFSPNIFTRLAAYLLALVILLMAFVRQTQLLLVVAAFAGVAWTATGNELWLAGQRAMPGWARGRMNATVIMFSQGAMALGGVIYGTTAQKFGGSCPTQPLPCRDNDAIMVPIFASLRANYESRKRGDRSGI